MHITVTKEQAIEVVQLNTTRIQTGIGKVVEAVEANKLEDAAKFLGGIAAICNQTAKNISEILGDK